MAGGLTYAQDEASYLEETENEAPSEKEGRMVTVIFNCFLGVLSIFFVALAWGASEPRPAETGRHR
jgi:hypothetical protein